MTQELLVRLALIVLFAPLVSFVVLVFIGKKLSRQGDWYGTSMLAICLALAVTILYYKLNVFPEPVSYSFTWVDFGIVPVLGSLQVVLGLTIDNLSAIMMVVVCLVSALVHLFSIGYMHGDVRYSRYFAYLGLFTFSMLMIVLTSNFFTMYVGWELVGLSSYLLIGHWYEKTSAADASKKAFIVNRVGDVGMFIGIMILYFTFHTFGFREIFAGIAGGTVPFGSQCWLTAAGILIFCGAVGKSAQFPLHVWLPDAMEGPTPVSALIHAATMVAAGVYLIARTFPMMTADALMVIAYIGAITAFISATIAVAQNDIKKVLAYSTISQLGYMVMGLGVGAFTAGFFHLVTHAMFKAGLFLGSGSVIHAMHTALHHKHDHHTDAQDIRNMGGLRKKLPVTFAAFLVYTLAISGVPLTSGFLSKDSILSGTLAFGSLTGHYLIPIIGFFVAGLTAFYMFRLVILTFAGTHAEPGREEHLHESPWTMTLPLIIFAVLSIFIFYAPNPVDPAGGWFAHAVERPDSAVPAAWQAAGPAAFEEAHHAAHLPAMALSLAMAALGILAAFLTYYWKKISADAWASRLSGLHKFLLNKWYFDELYGAVVVGGTLALTRVLRWFDTYIVDGLVNGVASWTYASVFGYSARAREKRVSAIAFLLVGVAVALLVGFWVGQWFWLQGSIGKSVTFGILSFLLTVYFFWAGAGGFDHYIVDGMVNGVGYFSGFFGILLQKLQTGKVQTYLAYVIAGVMILFYFLR
ncbi:MAG TPA: NADH-quinone oxidoreductase subunit L [Bacteroidota bacterium]|nr:NADH-quinone oxidoreductase subunit L [Bacteroidota bacterium]